jgi:adiponectin receptor
MTPPSLQLDLAAQFVAIIFVLFVRRFRKPAWRPLRGFLFSFMASSAFYPIIYACYLHGYDQMNVEAGAWRYALTVIIYLTAVTIYAVRDTGRQPSKLKSVELTILQIRMPEAWRPGQFDIWGHSHQIFHVLMAVGLTVHFAAFAKAFDYTHASKKC